MSFNHDLASRFSRAASLLELLGEDAFRVNAMARAARTFEDHPADLASIAGDAAKLREIPGVGPKIADKVVEFARSGTIAEFDELRARVPPGLPPLLDLPGLGPKTLAMLWREGGVTDAASLRRIIDDGSILSLPRMGAKSVEKLRQALSFGQTLGQRQNIGIVLPFAERLADLLRRLPGVRRVEIAGSLRRGKETVADLDLLAEAEHPAAVNEAFRALPGVRAVLAAGDQKSSVRIALAGGVSRWGDASEMPDIQADLRVVMPGRFGAALMYFTGSKEHNVLVRERARAMGMTLNEHGLFHEPATPPDDWSAVRPVAAATEEEVFHALGLHPIPPEARESVTPIDAYAQDAARPADPLGIRDIVSELHAHTTASDGRLAIEELAARALERGFHTIAVTDHSRSSVQANGLSIERLLEHIENVRRAGERVGGITILAGSEVDILADGTLDYPDDVLRRLDVVVASPHASLSQDEETSTRRLLAAVQHPLVHILGHPTGRLINRRPGLSPRTAELFAAAARCNTALEINAHWMRLDLRDTHAREALALGCLVTIDCDVHEPEDFDNLRYGVLTARRAGLTTERCPNTWDQSRLLAWLRSKR
jgi:DNA polymerase (family 10)